METGQKIALTGIMAFIVGYCVGSRKRKAPITGKISNAWGGRPDPGFFQDIVDEGTSIFQGRPTPGEQANDLVNYAAQNDWEASQKETIQNLAETLNDFDLDCLYQYYLVYKNNDNLSNIPVDVDSYAFGIIQNNNLPL